MRVKIYLPRLLAENERAPGEVAIEALPPGNGSEAVLVVEDDDGVREHSAHLLGELGYRVFEAPDGAAALEILEREATIALLFTDVGLPGGMNGRQLADEARRRRPDLKVLYNTGYARNAIVHHGRLDPGVRLLTKPFTAAELAAALRAVFDSSADPPRILLVEDEALLRMSAVEQLEDLGFRVEEAANAAEALHRVRLLEGRVSVALVDVGLPDRRGDSLAAELRAMYAHLPIVIATGYSEAAMRQRFAADALVRFLDKPYSAAQLAAALRAAGVHPPAGDAG